jgi:hypothetical protein
MIDPRLIVRKVLNDRTMEPGLKAGELTILSGDSYRPCVVAVVAESTFGGVPTAIYDLFRIANGKIAEHWDTLETIPLRDQWKNSNGKF